MKISFFGAAEEVTGSRYLIEHKTVRVLVDCGLFQGDTELTQRNWHAFPVDPSSIDAVILTHAHIDHTGYLPVLVKNGFRGKVYSSHATYELSKILLVDSGSVHEIEAKKHRGRPLYTQEDAEAALRFFHVVDYDTKVSLDNELSFMLTYSGHIIGSSFVVLSNGEQTVTFSGDLGRPQPVIMKPRKYITNTDYLILESTYGNRSHGELDPLKAIGDTVLETIEKGGKLLIPSFAVDRAQMILYYLYQLKQKSIIPDIPVFLDSPMAIGTSELYCRFKEQHVLANCKEVFNVAKNTFYKRQSKHIDDVRGSAVIIAGSGMAEGGRILDRFKQHIGHHQNTVLFVGYQVEGTRGYQITHGAQETEIDEKVYPIRADIKKIDMLSAHADYEEILSWLSHLEHAPKKIFLTHGTLESAQYLQKKIQERFGWNVIIPHYLESFELI